MTAPEPSVPADRERYSVRVDTPEAAGPATPEPEPAPEAALTPGAALAPDAVPESDAVPVSGQPAEAAETPESPPSAGRRTHLGRQLAIYTVLRVALVVVLAAVLAFFMPLIVALLFAIIVQLPLAWLLFSGPRAKLNDAMAQASSRRRAERARLQSALSGDPDSADRAR